MLLPHHVFMYCRKCGVELKPNAPRCAFCGAGVEDYFEDEVVEVELSSPRLTTPIKREHPFAVPGPDRLDLPSDWPEGEVALLLPVPVDPHNPVPDEFDEEQFPMYIPISAPVEADSPNISREADCEIVPIERSIIIPIEEILPNRSMALQKQVEEVEVREFEESAFFTYLIRDESSRQRTHIVSSVLLLLLAALSLFVFAYFAQN